MAFDLEQRRRRAEEFIGALDLEYYLHYSGQKADCDTTAIYQRYPELFTRDAFFELEERYQATPYENEELKRQLAYLVVFTVDGYLGNETKHISDEIANVESATEFVVDGETIGLRQAGVILANESDRARRRRIHDARLRAIDEQLNPLLSRYWRRCHELAQTLNYPEYLEMYSDLKGLDYLSLAAELSDFQRTSGADYALHLENLAIDRLGLTLDQLHVADLPYLWRAPQYDKYFSADRLLPALRQTLRGFGIDPDTQSQVHLDTAVRPNKSPRAFCAPVHIPGEIYLSVLPQGGQDDYNALLHEAGHAQHFAHTRADLAFEYRCLGDNSVTESFAFLFDHLMLNRHWLEEMLDYTDCHDFVRFAVLNELYFMRRYIGKLTYETRLHAQTGDLSDMRVEYSRCLMRALCIDAPPEMYLYDVDDGFYAASYLRAWMMEGALRIHAQQAFGLDWFRNPKTADWLRELWSGGQRMPVDRMLLARAGGRLDAGAVWRLIIRALNN